MTRIKHICIIMTLCMLPVFMSCEWGSESDASRYSFAVVATGNGFQGYYRVDGTSNKSVYFTQTVPTETGSIYYSFEQNLDSPTTLYISVTAVSTDVSSIDIQIFKDKNMVKEVLITQSDSTVKISNIVSYDFTTTTTTTTSSVESIADESSSVSDTASDVAE